MNDPRATWVVSAIEDFVIDREFDAICLVESLYYVRLERVKGVLEHCRHHGKSTYIRIWDVETHAPFIRQLGPCMSPKPDLFLLL